MPVDGWKVLVREVENTLFLFGVVKLLDKVLMPKTK